MDLILFDDNNRDNLLPFTYTRPVCEIRVGIMTIREKWEKAFNTKASYITESYLSEKYPLRVKKLNLLVNGSVCPNKDLLWDIVNLPESHKLVFKDLLIAAKLTDEHLNELIRVSKENRDVSFCDLLNQLEVNNIKSSSVKLTINNVWDMYSKNSEAIYEDFKVLTEGRKSQVLSSSNKILGKEFIFVEEGVKVECAIINATTGPVYLGKDAEIMEGSMVRGPFVMCEGAALKLGTKVYGPTTIGPFSKVGGEVSNSVIFGHSNKGHDGFLGNSVIGEWCNLGADTNNSNLKNNYGDIKIWNYFQNNYINTGLQFCGLIMGDHSKSGINTMFNTGTVVGVNANVFGAGFLPKHIPSFSWGGADGFITYELEKSFEVAQKVMERRLKRFDNTEKNILSHVFSISEKYRS